MYKHSDYFQGHIDMIKGRQITITTWKEPWLVEVDTWPEIDSIAQPSTLSSAQDHLSVDPTIMTYN